ncbi:MAG: type II toxin-antitoxin system Phd/YefM family antitoxin [bacterium]
MKFVSVRELRNEAARVWGDLKSEREIVLTSNGRPVAIMTAVTGENLETEIRAVRRARALLALERIHDASLEKGLDSITTDEIDAAIGESRRGKKRGKKRGKTTR